jgi:transposase
MTYYIGCDAHKKYSVFAGISDTGEVLAARRVDHKRESYRSFLESLPPASRIAIESVGNWYWMVDEMEKAGHIPTLTHPAKAKLMMGQINKTDKLDAEGLAVLARNGTLPAVWIPPGELRDQRELPRVRMALSQIRTKLKNRIHSAFAKYGITFEEVSDLFSGKGRKLLLSALDQLPPETRLSIEEELEMLDYVAQIIKRTEARIGQVIEMDETMQLLQTIPGVGPILAIVIALEIGSVERFAAAEKLASYSGKVPRVNSSGGKTYHGKVRQDVNRYLKWAFTEAANSIALQQKRWPDRHVVRLYQRIRKRKGHAKAITAVGRHLAEAAYWMLKRNEPYCEPGGKQPVSNTRR